MMSWRDRILAACFAAEFAFVCGCLGVAAQERAIPAAGAPAVTAVPCGGDEITRANVSRVLDGRNFVLDDGREVHLAAVEVPLLPVPGDLHAAAGGTAAKAALAALVAGAQVVLRRAQYKSDRYGRIVAYADASRKDSARSVQAELVSAGFARVGDDVGNEICAAELLRRENAARQAKLGLWANPYYDPVRADKPADILAQRGHFALVEGNVVSVHESGATVYVNFGRRWSRDFAVTIRKRNERSFAAAGLDLKGLAGQRVRVRGWIEARGGNAGSAGDGYWHAPWIEVTHPEQIERADRD